MMNRKSLADLPKSHQTLEHQITEAMIHKAVDALDIVDLKGNSKSKTRLNAFVAKLIGVE
jgi:hypothetical protein